MGLFRKKIKSPIEGVAQITGCSAHDGEARWQNCRLHLAVQVPGWEPYAAEVHQIAPRAKWPQPGMTVPVIVSQDDPHKLKVDFDRVADKADTARQLAEQQAAAMRGEPVARDGGGVPGGSPMVVGDINALTPEQLAKVEQLTGLDLDGDGTVGGGDDRVGQLERLARLHATGALTDGEFEQEKRRILGG